MSSTFTAIDLSQIPAPDVIEPLDYEAIYGEMKAKLLEYIPDFDDSIESDPAVRVLQVAAYFRLLDRQRANDAAKAVMLAYAKGADLDNIAAFFGVTRLTITPADEQAGTLAVMESDDDLRYRVTIAPEGYSVAGPAGAYEFFALSADSDVASARPVSPSPAVVDVYVLSRSATGIPSPQLLATVAAALSDDEVRPMGDRVTVYPAAVKTYAINARIWTFDGPDAAVVLATAQKNAEAFAANSRKLGRDITLSAINAALFAGGTQKVELLSPAADIINDDTEAAICTGITLIHAGVAE